MAAGWFEPKDLNACHDFPNKKMIQFHKMIAIGALLVASLSAFAAPDAIVTATIHSDHVTGQISDKIYGHFLEHIYHSVNGGLWGDLVWNRSFEEAVGRGWSVNGGCLISPAATTGESKFSVGYGSLRDGEFTVEARKIEGAGPLLIGVHGGSVMAALGGGENQRHELRRHTFNKVENQPVITGLQTNAGGIATGRWYSIRMICQGTNVRLWLDGQPVFDVSDTVGQQFGQVCVGVQDGRAEFRHFKIVGVNQNEFFRGLPAPARHWQAVGNGEITLDDQNPLNDGHSLKIKAAASEFGVEQTSFSLRQGDVCRGSLWVRGEAPGGLVVRLLDGTVTLFEKTLPAPGSEWKDYPLEILPKKNASNATLQIVTTGKAAVWLDQVSLMPDSSRTNGGFRPDLFQAMKAIQPTLIRWPGGSFLNGYEWQHGIGLQVQRRGKKGWDEFEPLSLGIDEFMDLCRRLNAQPLIPLDVKVEKPDDIQATIDLIEYCNSPADSKWGRLRAQNGHPEPYRVKYWEIGNENWGLGTEKYSAMVRAYVPLMKQADPSIQIIVCGSGGLSKEGRGLAWDRDVIERCADLADFISIHHYEKADNFGTGPAKFVEFWREVGQCIARSKNPTMKLFVSEWNAGTTDWRSGLYCGGLLNEFERNSEIAPMASPALWLRHVSAPKWDNAFINFDSRTWFAGANYVVMKLWREHYAPQRLEIAGNLAPLNAIATKSADGRRVFVKVVNPSENTVVFQLKTEGAFKPLRAGVQQVASGDLLAQNSLGQRERLRVVETKAKLIGSTVSFNLPKWSVAVLELTE